MSSDPEELPGFEIQVPPNFTCCVCLNLTIPFCVLSPCGHISCRSCAERLRETPPGTCPQCRGATSTIVSVPPMRDTVLESLRYRCGQCEFVGSLAQAKHHNCDALIQMSTLRFPEIPIATILKVAFSFRKDFVGEFPEALSAQFREIVNNAEPVAPPCPMLSPAFRSEEELKGAILRLIGSQSPCDSASLGQLLEEAVRLKLSPTSWMSTPSHCDPQNMTAPQRQSGIIVLQRLIEDRDRLSDQRVQWFIKGLFACPRAAGCNVVPVSPRVGRFLRTLLPQPFGALLVLCRNFPTGPREKKKLFKGPRDFLMWSLDVHFFSDCQFPQLVAATAENKLPCHVFLCDFSRAMDLLDVSKILRSVLIIWDENCFDDVLAPAMELLVKFDQPGQITVLQAETTTEPTLRCGTQCLPSPRKLVATEWPLGGEDPEPELRCEVNKLACDVPFSQDATNSSPAEAHLAAALREEGGRLSQLKAKMFPLAILTSQLIATQSEEKRRAIERERLALCKNPLHPAIDRFLHDIHRVSDPTKVVDEWNNAIQTVFMPKYNEIVSTFKGNASALIACEILLEHFVRELQERASGDENIRRELVKLQRNLIRSGLGAELMSGDSFQWNETVKEAMKNSSTKGMIVVSIVGPESSGKSTLLNLMFGRRFRANFGRCTRGLNIALTSVLLPDGTEKDIVLLDSEGLLSKTRKDPLFDKKMLFLLMSISSVMILNYEGELNTSVTDYLELFAYCAKHWDMTSSRPNFYIASRKNNASDLELKCPLLLASTKELFLNQELDLGSHHGQEAQKLTLCSVVQWKDENMFFFEPAFIQRVHRCTSGTTKKYDEPNSQFSYQCAQMALQIVTDASSSSSALSFEEWFDASRHHWDSWIQKNDAVFNFSTLRDLIEYKVVNSFIAEFDEVEVRKTVWSVMSKVCECCVTLSKPTIPTAILQKAGLPPAYVFVDGEVAFDVLSSKLWKLPNHDIASCLIPKEEGVIDSYPVCIVELRSALRTGFTAFRVADEKKKEAEKTVYNRIRWHHEQICRTFRQHISSEKLKQRVSHRFLAVRQRILDGVATGNTSQNAAVKEFDDEIREMKKKWELENPEPILTPEMYCFQSVGTLPLYNPDNIQKLITTHFREIHGIILSLRTLRERPDGRFSEDIVRFAKQMKINCEWKDAYRLLLQVPVHNFQQPLLDNLRSLGTTISSNRASVISRTVDYFSSSWSDVCALGYAMVHQQFGNEELIKKSRQRQSAFDNFAHECASEKSKLLSLCNLLHSGQDAAKEAATLVFGELELHIAEGFDVAVDLALQRTDSQHMAEEAADSFMLQKLVDKEEEHNFMLDYIENPRAIFKDWFTTALGRPWIEDRIAELKREFNAKRRQVLQEVSDKIPHQNEHFIPILPKMSKKRAMDIETIIQTSMKQDGDAFFASFISSYRVLIEAAQKGTFTYEYSAEKLQKLVDAHYEQCRGSDCQASCPYCTSMCTANHLLSADRKHKCKVHFPQGLAGWHYEKTKKLLYYSCEEVTIPLKGPDGKYYSAEEHYANFHPDWEIVLRKDKVLHQFDKGIRRFFASKNKEIAQLKGLLQAELPADYL